MGILPSSRLVRTRSLPAPRHSAWSPLTFSAQFAGCTTADSQPDVDPSTLIPMREVSVDVRRRMQSAEQPASFNNRIDSPISNELLDQFDDDYVIPQFNPAVSQGSPQQAPSSIPTVYPLEVLSPGASNSSIAPRKRQRRARGDSAPARTSASMHERPPHANKEHANQDSIEEMLSTEGMLLRLFPGERGSFREYFCQIASPGEIRVLYLAMCDDAHRDMSLYVVKEPTKPTINKKKK